MVEDRIGDGERIAQLLASELTGLETGPLAAVAVVGADPGATPTPEGTRAYDVAYRDERIGSVLIYPGRACVRLHAGDGTGSDPVDPDATRDASVPVSRDGGDVVLSVESGVAVKRATDVLRATLPDAGNGPE
jgi:hypothetical protein